jgi:secondary thiamine-phosphate synthase enzyme
MHEIFSVDTRGARQSVDITDEVRAIVGRSGASEGLCQVMALHSTAAVVLNETHDPNLATDIEKALERMVPSGGGWLHDRIDNNAHAHIKAAMLGPSELMPVQGGELLLGTWQRLILMDFDGPRTRRISVTLLRASP